MTDEITRICAQCGEQFKYVLKPGYPRKYCDVCKVAKKKDYELTQLAKAAGNNIADDIAEVVKPGVPEETKGPAQRTDKYQSTIFEVKEKPHSYEFGKASARHKIYYNRVGDLQMQIRLLENAGLIEPEEFKE